MDSIALAVLDAIAAPVCLVDDAGVITVANRAWRSFATIHGHSPDDGSPGTRYLDLWRPLLASDPPTFDAMGNALRRTGSGESHAVTFAVTWVRDARQYSVRGQAGRVNTPLGTRIVLTHEYLGDRPLAETEIERSLARLQQDLDELRRSEVVLRRYAWLADQTRDAVLFVSYPSGLILDANLAAVRQYGYSREELLGLHIGRLRAASAQSDLSAQMQRASDGGVLFETRHQRRDGTVFPVEVSSLGSSREGGQVLLSIVRDISQRKEEETRREELVVELSAALENVKTLRGIVPICAACKKIRDDAGFWHQVEEYVRDHTDAEFSHGVCPDCAKRLYPEIPLPQDRSPR